MVCRHIYDSSDIQAPVLEFSLAAHISNKVRKSCDFYNEKIHVTSSYNNHSSLCTDSLKMLHNSCLPIGPRPSCCTTSGHAVPTGMPKTGRPWFGSCAHAPRHNSNQDSPPDSLPDWFLELAPFSCWSGECIPRKYPATNIYIYIYKQRPLFGGFELLTSKAMPQSTQTDNSIIYVYHTYII